MLICGFTWSKRLVPRKKPSFGSELALPSTTSLGPSVTPPPCPLLEPRLDVAGDLVAVLAGDERAHVDALGVAGAHLDRFRLFLQKLDQRIGRRAHRHDPGERPAALAQI